MALPVLPLLSLAIGVTALALSSKKGKKDKEPKQASTPQPIFTVDPPVQRPSQPGFSIDVPQPRFDAVSPGLPIQPITVSRPPPQAQPIEVLEPEPEPAPTPVKIPTPVGEIVVPGETVEDIADVVSEVVKNVPEEFLPPDAVPIAPPQNDLNFSFPTELATDVYNITLTGIRQLKGSEVKRIKEFQNNEGLTADGLYGPDTAEALIDYGFVPGAPWIWPKPQSESKAEWRALTAAWAVKDPQRAEEWLAAGDV